MTCRFLPQAVCSRVEHNTCMTTCATCFDKEYWKTRVFVFQNTCFARTVCTGSGRRTTDLQFAKISYPNNIDRSLNESPDDKIRKYRVDYNNNPLHGIIYVSGKLTVDSSRRFLSFSF
jgi:hypothetical protein